MYNVESTKAGKGFAGTFYRITPFFGKARTQVDQVRAFLFGLMPWRLRRYVVPACRWLPLWCSVALAGAAGAAPAAKGHDWHEGCMTM